MAGIADLFIEFIQKMIEFCYQAGAAAGFANYGFAIILFTLIIKLAMYPLTRKQIQSTKAMQEIQPQMKALQERYKNDKQRLQEETLKLYKETGFNPLAGCLPLVAQMPVLMGIFFALKGFDYGGSPPSFLWMPSLAEPDPYYIMPVLSGLTTLAQSYYTMPDTSSGQNRMMLYFMPLFIGYISLQFAAGLVLYWVTTNILQVAQQFWHARGDRREAAAKTGQKSTSKRRP
ncbi:MAG: YidC/Oxa1 family membrane protein insertase [Acidaminococcales bacterium]|jgi:YidC/Oxa1 family membrane protein insertase|nr:YidC/Oxa1 family membrane protein insertase [Acidaminococcales bacterium]